MEIVVGEVWFKKKNQTISLLDCLLNLAVAFGYFENLFTLRDAVKIQRELNRIKSLNRLLDQVGQQEHLYEIFVEATEELLVQLSEAVQKGVQDDSFLLKAFNSEYNANAIITHFRVSGSTIKDILSTFLYFSGFC